MKAKSKFIFLTFIVTFGTSFSIWADQQDPALTKAMLDRYSLISPTVLENHHYWIELGYQSDLGFNQSGLQTGVGYRLNYFGFDMRFSSGKTTYGMFHKLEPYNSNKEYADNSESVLSRKDSDSWSYWYLEPGLSISGRYFSGILPQFTERVRVGFIYGNFKDNVNHIPFKSFVLNAETSLIYQLNPNSPWSLCGSLNWNSGMLVRYYVNTSGLSKSYGIPADWIGTTLGMIYSF